MNRTSKKHIATLVPSLRPIAKQFLKLATGSLVLYDKPWSTYTVEITEGKRDIMWQAGLYSQGRRWQSMARRWVIHDANKIVTDTIMGSNHLQGLAFDIALWNPSNGHYIWPNPRQRHQEKAKKAKKLWLNLAGIGRQLGLNPGADWRHQDFPHYEVEL